ncbi:hypothetical protein [Paraburkholderia fynbosensis]|uniref:Uncharacterized protein n=1 Tax=Paraburkholderia fynbosensis TaxID=1200993 RepID=A0A6J5GPC7_9BURK|nr:hypothetical protein [Paraburkholderia fynbosensis]CAB3804575.1 hypothetical protein LMG27177_05680 [Paraburkholderia fynbosensis]
MWAITSYFNPAKYARRLENYRNFRKELRIPLVTAELSFDGTFELQADDADVVVRASGGSVLWQKERLLNLALDAVPDDIRLVCWLDCDVIFENENWHHVAAEMLRTYPLVQLFSELVDLKASEAQWDRHRISDLRSRVTGNSIAWLNSHAMLDQSNFSPRTGQDMRTACFGLAWAGSRELIAKHRFYDAMIIGSGDRSMVCAMYGRFNDAINTLELNAARAKHYLPWAKSFHESVNGNVGCVEGALFHLWHGEIKDRHYRDRHSRFSHFPFDPAHNLTLSESGAWQLVDASNACTDFLQAYFHERREDG